MKLELSYEQYEKIGRDLWYFLESIGLNAYNHLTRAGAIRIGRKAVELSNAEVLPIVLGPVSPEEQEQAARSPRSTSCWYDVPVEERFSIILANRLARFTAPKDTAVEALEKRFSYCLSRELIVEAVAVVRAADREEGR